eukprot:TRINITY_DN23398_c0_g2_i1.p1 TRINITY_DN23398_c0_g2~~TRINITY_DN23398_c0_g2_i1.p1  ORF type:complete len:214 (+),score=38.02 TRINITY_DN23398_c0_g2_i1:90-731(+)
MVPVLTLVAGGGIVTALCAGKSWKGSGVGVLLQIASSVAYGVKYTLMKGALGDAHKTHGISAREYYPRSESGCERQPPSKLLIASITQPLTGLVSLCAVPLFEQSWAMPQTSTVLYFGAAVTGILVFELRLVELTSPLTVAVLAALHNVIIVLFFVAWDGEAFGRAESAGFAVSTVGVAWYAYLKHAQLKVDTAGADAQGIREPDGISFHEAA